MDAMTAVWDTPLQKKPGSFAVYLKQLQCFCSYSISDCLYSFGFLAMFFNRKIYFKEQMVVSCSLRVIFV